ncbi:GNAT family N-acetyltransferase [Vallitalea okinawensis]|uniref:GNAT family N-acetyltransferase n=1 Tax=Vallitalea okinawensis TaxID=2078660 RepID=UPI001A9A34A0|nr:GNAT family N-acetyltransferase [Vallitalea okinawensis]
MKKIFVPMTQAYASEIAYEWKYDGEYAFYDMTADEEDLQLFLDPKQWENLFAVVNEENELIGFYSYFYNNEILELGFGMKPQLTGKGLGSEFVFSGIQFAQKHFKYEQDYIMLSVAKFNKRAIKAYEKLGFKPVKEFIQETNGGQYEFISMKLDLINYGY